MIQGLRIKADFISEEEEARLLSLADAGTWRIHGSGQKREQFYFAESYGIAPAAQQAIPEMLAAFAARLGRGEPYRLIISDYAKGQGMAAHFDETPFPDIVGCTVSLASECEWEFTRGHEVYRFTVPRRSLLTFTGEARYLWKHAVLPVPARRVSLYFSFRGEQNAP